MKNKLTDADLILNSDGSLYHIHCAPGDLAETIILVGDPDRVPQVSKHFDRIVCKKRNREFVTHTGELGSQSISVLSTGIGAGNIDIVMNEVDACFNIDLSSRQLRSTPKPLNFIRLGTTGALQPQIDVDQMILTTHAATFDGLFQSYAGADNETELLMPLRSHFQALPYADNLFVAKASSRWLDRFAEVPHQGITLTCLGFYGPQSRHLRLPLSQPEIFDLAQSFHYDNHKIVNFEMETGNIFGFGQLMNHHCCSISTAINNRCTDTVSKNPEQAIEKMIEWALAAIV